MGLRKRIEGSELPARILGALLAAYLKLCWHTGRWQFEGEGELDALLAQGPVTFVFWHGHTLLGPPALRRRANVALPRDPSPAGKLSAATQRHFGTVTFEIDVNGGNFAAVRQIMKLNREGYSLGLTADGPKGPNRVVKRGVIDWARLTGRPVVLFGWSSRAAKTLGTWDKMLVPLPFSGGWIVIRQWQAEIPKKPADEDYKHLRADMAAELNSISKRADKLAGRTS